MPIWKKEVYAGTDGSKWKENAESTAPRIGDGAVLQQSASARVMQVFADSLATSSLGQLAAVAAVAVVGYVAGAASRRR